MELSDSYVQVVLIAAVLLAVVMAGFTIVGAIAFWKTGKGGAKSYTLLIQRGDLIRILSVAGIVLAVFFLALAGILTEAAVVAVLSGIAGYVLGSLDRRAGARDQLHGDSAA